MRMKLVEMYMPSVRPQRPPRIVDRRGGTLLGPIGPLSWRQRRTPPQDVYVYTMSEIVMCEWVCVDGDDWVRDPTLVIEMNEDICPRFKPGSVRAVQAMAWPSSLSHNSEEDAGWAIDRWEAKVDRAKSGDAVHIQLELAITGEGTRLNRIGYTWTAYVSEIAE